MLYYERMEKDILEVFDKFQQGTISLDDLKSFQEETYRNNITYRLQVDPEDNYNFLRCEKYWILLLYIVCGRIDKNNIKEYVYRIKAEDFIKRVKFSNLDTVCQINRIDRPIVYFDNNTYIYLKKYIPIEKVSRKYQYIYSPAHLEELANSIRENDFQYSERIERDLYYLSKLTDNVEFLPDSNNGIKICRESPDKPLKRVIKDFDGTVLSEQIEKDFLEKRKRIRDEYALKVRGDNISGVLSSTVAEKALNQFKWYQEYKEESSKRVFWEHYKSDYSFLFESLTVLVKLLDILDNNPEPIKKYRSHLHDTTHLIYATRSDLFITNDKRLENKANEIFRFLDIPVKVKDYEKFLESWKPIP
ncbi:MAG: hypothetical protein NC433_17325 [Clostridiales bacterium]|nr:hypothetical protein [Clostridiales bacterium]